MVVLLVLVLVVGGSLAAQEPGIITIIFVEVNLIQLWKYYFRSPHTPTHHI